MKRTSGATEQENWGGFLSLQQFEMLVSRRLHRLEFRFPSEKSTAKSLFLVYTEVNKRNSKCWLCSSITIMNQPGTSICREK